MTDKVSDKKVDKIIETFRFGFFKFTLGINFKEIDTLFKRIEDAQNRFKSSPLLSISSALEEEVIVSSVFGTNTIEQGKLTEDEIRTAFNKSPEEIQIEQERRVVNIKKSYDYIASESKEKDWAPGLLEVCHIHKLIYDGLTDSSGELAKLGVLRDNPKDEKTIVGNKEHGGVYIPPQFRGDIKLLLESLLAWNKELIDLKVPALIRAPLVHFYFELIHPFEDGNGRVGRVLEAGILYSDGFRYAPFAQANYYLKHIHHYFALFNECRKLSDKKQEFPNHQFVQFFLEGMFETINYLHDRVNVTTHYILLGVKLKSLSDSKLINKRQYQIVNKIAKEGALTKKELFASQWHKELYLNLTDKTRQRDLDGLQKLDMLSIDQDQRLVLHGMYFLGR